MIRLVLFDIDGTLIRTGGAGVKAFERTFETEFQLPNATQAVRFAGRTDSSLVRECFRKCGIDPGPDHFRRFFDRYVVWLEQLLPLSRGGPCPGVQDLICRFQTLAEPPLLGLLTGNIRRGAEIKLSHFKLWHFFQLGAFGDDHENRDHLAFLARDRGNSASGRHLRGDEILVIGDTPLDVACARAIDARMLAVATGGHPLDELRQCGPTWAVDNLEKIAFESLCG